MENYSEIPQEEIDIEGQRQKILQELHANKEDVQDLLIKERVLHTTAGSYDIGEGMRASLQRQVDTLKKKISLTTPVATLGTNEGQVLIGSESDTHEDLRDKLLPIDPHKRSNLNFMSGFVFKNSNYPHVSIFKYDLPLDDKRRATFAELLKNLDAQHALVIDDDLKEVPLS